MDTILGIIERTLEVYRMEGPQDGKTTRAATEEIVALVKGDSKFVVMVVDLDRISGLAEKEQ